MILEETSKFWGKFVVWHLTEDHCHLMEQMKISPVDIKHTSQWAKGRRQEYLGGRFLIIKYLKTSFENIKIDEFGKPYVDNFPNFSISHSGKYIALGIHDQSIGIDIQIPYHKITSVSHKFCTDQDHINFRDAGNILIQEHFIWSVKEAVYKAYGKKQLDFKKHILIKNVRIRNHLVTAHCEVIKDDKHEMYAVRARSLKQMILAKAIGHNDINGESLNTMI